MHSEEHKGGIPQLDEEPQGVQNKHTVSCFVIFVVKTFS